MLILGGCLLWIFLFVHSPDRSVYLGLGCLLVCLPTLHPWYLVLISPFLVFYPSRAWLALQAGVVFTLPVLALDYRSGIFQEIHWLKILEYGPFYCLLLYGLFRYGWMCGGRTFSAPCTVSVVVPTLNEADNIERCLAALNHRPGVSETLVVDGGSTDATVEIARKKGATVCVAQKGRGLQIKKGIARSSGDLVVVLHADCLPVEGLFSTITQTMIRQPCAVGGAVGMRFEDRRLRSRWIAFLNNLRARITGIAFGDQAQFFRRPLLRTMGGFPEMMLMEDVELSLRLKEIGPVLFIPAGVCVSSRRWHGKGFVGNFLSVLALFFRFLAARRFAAVEQLGRKYYRLYYRDR
jgi:rSAM/selenodomain-associated transferase 2